MLALVETRLASATPLQDAIQRPARLGSLEIGRFVAATMVFLTHITATATKHAAMPGDDIFGGVTFPGAIAVQYFFVLSGFVMMTSHRADFGNFLAAPRFWWRRACRIYPMYWISLSIVCIYLWGFLDWPMGLQLFSLAPINGADFVPPAWSLRYEMAFYIMFGLCLLPYVGRPLLAAWVLAVTLTWFPPLQLPLIGQSVSMFLASLGSTQAAFFVAPFEFYFFAGLLGGWLFSAHPPRLENKCCAGDRRDRCAAAVLERTRFWLQLRSGNTGTDHRHCHRLHIDRFFGARTLRRAALRAVGAPTWSHLLSDLHPAHFITLGL